MTRPEFVEKLRTLYMIWAIDQETRKLNNSVIPESVLQKRQNDADRLFHQLYADFCAMEKAEKAGK